jgi:hypothetical protein
MRAFRTALSSSHIRREIIMHRSFAAAASTRANSFRLSVAVLALVLCGCGERAQESPATSPSQPSVVAPAPDVVGAAPSPEATTASAAAPSAAAPATTAELPVLFEQLEKPDYKAAYLTLFTGAGATPGWMKEGGTASPGRVVTVGGTEYELYSHCKPHDCGDNMMYVLFSRDRKHAWALAMESGKPRTFGNPDAALADFLKAQACKDLAGAC